MGSPTSTPPRNGAGAPCLPHVVPILPPPSGATRRPMGHCLAIRTDVQMKTRMRRRLWASIWAAVLLSWLLAAGGGSRVHAYDVELDVDTVFRGYEVRARAARAFWTRRRFSQRLSLRLVQGLQSAPDDDPGPRLQVYVDLRLDRELGDTCLVGDERRCFRLTDGEVRARYEPLADDGGLSVPLAYAQADRLPLGMRVWAGRQLVWDPIGLARVDGLRLSTSPFPWLSASVAAGALVRRTSVAGRDTFVPAGVPRLDLPADVLTANDRVEPPATARLLSASAYIGRLRGIRLGGHYRNVRDRTGLLQREAAVSLGSRSLAPLVLDAHGVFDARTLDLVDGQAEASLRTGPAVTRARLRRQVPRFDYGSIWAFFAVAPTWQASVGTDVQLAAPVTFGLELRGRRLSPDGARRELDLGVLGRASLARGRLVADAVGFVWEGDLGESYGADAGGSYRLARWLELQVRASLYRVEGVGAALMPSLSFGQLLGAAFRIAEGAQASLEASHSHSRPAGHRLSLLAWLNLEAWK